MGFLDFLKKEKKEEGNNIFSTDGLIGFIRSNLDKPTDENVLKALEAIAKPADDLEHLTPDGDLPWGWHNHTKKFRETIEKEYSYFLNNWVNSRGKDVDQKTKYEALKSFVLYLEDLERLCKSKGECFEFWYYEILTSRDYLEKRKAELAELEQH